METKDEVKTTETTVETTETGNETKTEEVKTDESAKEIEHLKKLLSKANSEAADYKKQLRSKMTEEEQKAAEIEAIKAENETFKKEKQVADISKGLMSWGLDSAKADSMAASLVDGDMTSFISGGKEYFETVSQKAIADAMDSQKLSTGKPPEKNDIDNAKEAKMRSIMGLPATNK